MLKSIKPADGPDRWTFDLVLNLLQTDPETDRLKSIDGFLSNNQSLITNPFLFQSDNKEGEFPSKDSLDLRGLTYSINEQMKKDSEDINKIISVNKFEILRIISQVSNRYSFQKTPIEHEGIIKNEIFINSILKERSTLIRLINFLLTNNDLPELNSKFSTLIFQSPSFIPGIINFIKQLVTIDILKASSNSIILSTVSTIVDLLNLLVSFFLKISIPANVVKLWFEFLGSIEFFKFLEYKIEQDSYQEIKSLTSIVSILVMGLNTNEDFFDFDSSYLKESEIITLINNTIVDQPYDPIVLYSWSILLGVLDDSVVSSVFGANFNIDQYSCGFSMKAIQLNCFPMIETYLKRVSYEKINCGILCSFIIAISPFLQLTDEISKTILTVFKEAPTSSIEKFFVDSNVQNMIYLSKVKFPELLSPYLRVLTINGSYAHNELSELDSYMSILSSSELNFDHLETDTIVLKDGHYLKLPYEQNKDVAIYLPPSTRGKLMPTSDQNLDAAIFKYKYNGWSLLGRILQNIILFGEEEEEEELVLVILELITNTISTPDIDTISDIFEKLSCFIEDGDIIDLLLKLFEQSLHQKNTFVLTQLTKLLTNLVSTFPQIVWSHLIRSDLLERRGRGGLITNILGGVETVNGTYDFTIEILKLFQNLINHAVSNEQDLNSYKVEVLPKFIIFTNQIFESFIHWDYKEQNDKYLIGSLILETYIKILKAVYGIDPNTFPNSLKITGVLATSAERIIGSFMSSSPQIRIINPILNTLDFITSSSSSSPLELNGQLSINFKNWVHLSLKFGKLLISIRSFYGLNPSNLEKCLFMKFPTLITIYNQYCSLRSPILQLITQLVKATWNETTTPSLLAYLGEFWTSSLVLTLGKDLEFKHEHFEVKNFLYSFFSSVIESPGQRGLSMIFLTGHGPSKFVSADSSKSLLKILKDNVTNNLEYYPESLSIHLMDAVAVALNSWSLHEEKDFTFVKILIKKLMDFSKPNNINPTNQQIIQNCYKYKLHSKVAEICALILFNCSENKINELDILELAKPLYQKFDYDFSLHANLLKNFQSKWPNLKLENFIRTQLSPLITKFDEDAIYDLQLLDQIIIGRSNNNNDDNWMGNDLIKGYRSDIISASLNLQFVSCQIACAKSCGALLTVYMKKENLTINSSFVTIIIKLLQANIDERVQIDLMKDIYRVRIELAFFFLTNVVDNNKEEENIKILKLAIQLLTSIDVLIKISKGESTIYRPLLRIITQCLSRLKSIESNELLEFVEIVIAKGVPILLDSIQEENFQNKLQDLTLFISITQNLFKNSYSEKFIDKIIKNLIKFNTLRSILNFYSKSHFFKFKGEYIFSELILTYIIELISIEPIADQLIKSGLFAILIQSPLSLKIQEGNISNLKNSRRLHNIWRNGLLSIVLILLSKFGFKILPETNVFINHFNNQFLSCIQNFQSQDSIITIPALQELEQIIMLEKALETLYYEFDKEIVNKIGLDRKILQNSLKHLLAHPKFLTSKIIPTTFEEQIWFEGDDKIRTKLVEKIVEQINDIIESLKD